MSSFSVEHIYEITSYINKYRNIHQSPPLIFNPTIETFSNSWANQLLITNTFQHSGNNMYGENLAYFQGYGVDVMALLKKAVDAWYNEEKLYDYSNAGFNKSTGHFTCLVWKASTEFGIGISIDSKSETAEIVMNTSPPGNVIGKFDTNVLPPITPVPVPTPTPVPVPEPTPIPVPVPVPIPVPVPVPVPVPAQTTVQSNNLPIYIANIINNLYNVINSLNSRKPKYFVVQQLMRINSQITEYTEIMNSLNTIIFYIQTRRPVSFITNAILNLINKLVVSQQANR